MVQFNKPKSCSLSDGTAAGTKCYIDWKDSGLRGISLAGLEVSLRMVITAGVVWDTDVDAEYRQESRVGSG